MRKKPKNNGNPPYGSILRLMIPPKALRKWFLCHVLIMIMVVFLWIKFNGGIVPTFLRSREPTVKEDKLSNILLYYPSTNNDGSRLLWARGINNMSSLQSVLQSRVHIFEADVMMNKQGKPDQSLVPVMGEPDRTGQFLFADWADLAVASDKAFKLHFHSVEIVEIALTILKEKVKVKRPIWLHSDILPGPFAKDPPVDGTIFVRAIKRLFPDATLSLGWVTGSHTDYSKQGYTWMMVMDMYEFLKSQDLLENRLLTISVRSSLIENSVLQLKWLCDNTGASLTVFHHRDDKNVEKNLMYAAYKFAPDVLFFDLNHRELEDYLYKYRHFSQERVHKSVHDRETVAFRPKAWLQIGFHKYTQAALASEDSIILYTPDVHIVTKSKYEPSEKIRLYGRVMFLDREALPVTKHSGLDLMFRAGQISSPDSVVGIRVSIGVLGDVVVESVGLPGVKVRQVSSLTPSSSYCYRFAVINADDHMSVKVCALSHCETLIHFREVNELNVDMRVAIPRTAPSDSRPISVKVSDRTRAAVIDQLIVEYSAHGVFTHNL